MAAILATDERSRAGLRTAIDAGALIVLARYLRRARIVYTPTKLYSNVTFVVIFQASARWQSACEMGQALELSPGHLQVMHTRVSRLVHDGMQRDMCSSAARILSVLLA